MNIEDKYRAELKLVRQNPDLLNNYQFVENALNSKHFERLRLNIAIYNDMRPDDYHLVQFLLIEEIKWRKSAGDGEVDNLYFCAFILALFKVPETIWLFWEIKNIDFDSGLGFDAEYLLAAGIERTYDYLSTLHYPGKTQLLTYIGNEAQTCIYAEEEINEWVDFKHSYFRCYKFPVTDSLYFLYSVNEKSLFLNALPEWVSSQNEWTRKNLDLYKLYARFAEDRDMQIEAVKASINIGGKDFLIDLDKFELGKLYVDNTEREKAYEILAAIIKGTNNVNRVRDCVEQLCRIIFNDKHFSEQVTIRSYKTVKAEQKRYFTFYPKVDGLIAEADNLFAAARKADTRNELFAPKNKSIISAIWDKLKGPNL